MARCGVRLQTSRARSWLRSSCPARSAGWPASLAAHCTSRRWPVRSAADCDFGRRGDDGAARRVRQPSSDRSSAPAYFQLFGDVLTLWTPHWQLYLGATFVLFRAVFFRAASGARFCNGCVWRSNEANRIFWLPRASARNSAGFVAFEGTVSVSFGARQALRDHRAPMERGKKARSST